MAFCKCQIHELGRGGDLPSLRGAPGLCWRGHSRWERLPSVPGPRLDLFPGAQPSAPSLDSVLGVWLSASQPVPPPVGKAVAPGKPGDFCGPVGVLGCREGLLVRTGLCQVERRPVATLRVGLCMLPGQLRALGPIPVHPCPSLFIPVHPYSSLSIPVRTWLGWDGRRLPPSPEALPGSVQPTSRLGCRVVGGALCGPPRAEWLLACSHSSAGFCSRQGACCCLGSRQHLCLHLALSDPDRT